MTDKETAFTFSHNDQDQMIGIIHNPLKIAADVGLLIIVGGPQYRIGAHRQYVHLARYAASQGIAAMRFDYQGIGDSGGIYPGFEHICPDIRLAIDEFLKHTPEINAVAIWGLCEGASAILLGASQHPAVSHIILVNPWVRSQSGLAKAYIKHYYLDRLKNPEFWKKIFSGNLNIMPAISGFLSNIKQAFFRSSSPDTKIESHSSDDSLFPERMRFGLSEYQGKAMLLMSGHDLVAREFDDLISTDKKWQEIIQQKITHRLDIAETDHTFSTEEWRMEAAKGTVDWLLSEKK